MKNRDKKVMVGKVLLLLSNLCCTECGVERCAGLMGRSAVLWDAADPRNCHAC